ncbi:MAG: hypothetical protein AVDCRST_MAG68-1897 [uncultured Gemmatimonadetes bacterium]|uniref:Uncharacterized protein n=1 Tax=uncultured Gemmatimonadota bacterium TaxID=203437 RepID=A0A6J4L103_9BACT|nr:MAG: hypothetical protein AVDCRST_MAG68-1897 [uncultured Gemmatimonadota bacterium]
MPPRKRIAVIAVHGVADQKPNESNAAIASLLVQHGERPGTRHGKYTPFVTHEVHLPQFPVIRPRSDAVQGSDGAPMTPRAAPDGGAAVAAAAQPPAVPETASNGTPRKPEKRTHGLWQIRSKRDYIENTLERRAEAPGAPQDEVRTETGRPPQAPPAEPDEAAGELGYHFMHMQLRDHDPDGSARSYVTTVLRSLRRGGPGVPVDTDAEAHPAADRHEDPDEREVDVYEVYWADHSRPAQGALGFFGTAYQLLLHIATLGRQAVDDTRLDYPSRPWNVIRWFQQAVVTLLTLPIPLLNLVLLIVGFGVIPAGAIAGYRHGPAIAVSTVLGVCGAMLAYHWMQKNVPAKPLTWSLLPFAAAAGGVALAFLGGFVLDRVSHQDDIGIGTAISVAWWVVGGAIAHLVASKYQRLRAGVLPVTTMAYGLSLLTFTYWMLKFRTTMDVVPRMELSTLYTMQLIFALLRVCWILLVLFSIMLVILWFVVRRDAKHDPRREKGSDFAQDERWSRCRAALRTGRLAIGLSAAAFLGFTLLAWAGIFSFTVSRFEVFSHIDTVQTAPLYARYIPFLLPDVDKVRVWDAGLASKDLVLARADTATLAKGDSAAILAAQNDSADFTVPEYFQGLIANSVTPAAAIQAVPMLAAVLILLWMAVPSVLAEGNTRADCTNPRTREMGRWLSRGLDSTRLVTHLIYAAVLIPLLYSALVAASRELGLTWLPAQNDRLELGTYAAAGTAGTLIATSALVIVGALVKFGGSALDVMLDVDNYLRTTPPEATPRALVCERYVSLLRHVAGAEGDMPYDGVVIVAHSLGALISADLLHFLRRERARGGDPALARLGFGAPGEPGRIPITLITMGNPLRQLLSRFFPHRYQWVRASPENGILPLPESDAAEPREEERGSTPDARLLGVRRWANLYRSGDYVGRALWLTEWYHRTKGGDQAKTTAPFFISSTRHGDVEVSEGCIGAGAHTHYWDMTAPDVSDRIDAMIATA